MTEVDKALLDEYITLVAKSICPAEKAGEVCKDCRKLARTVAYPILAMGYRIEPL